MKEKIKITYLCGVLFSLRRNEHSRIYKKIRWQYGDVLRWLVTFSIILLSSSSSLMEKVKVKQSHYRPEVPRGFQKVKVPRLFDSGPEWWYGCQTYAPAAFTPQEMLLVLISVRGWVDPRAVVRLEGIWMEKVDFKYIVVFCVCLFVLPVSDFGTI
jgi:hypothetical protein